MRAVQATLIILGKGEIIVSDNVKNKEDMPVTAADPQALNEFVSSIQERNKEAVAKLKEQSQKDIFDLLEEDIKASDLPQEEKTARLAKLIALKTKKVHILLVGATGAGKSSTINALFNMDVAKIGVGVDPETESITSYQLGNLIIYDTPGLGDGKNDSVYTDLIIRKLCEQDDEGKPVIDLVLVVLDASSKDLGTSYQLINDVILPCIGKENSERVLVALNQADMAMKGKHWNAEKNEPDEVLQSFLKEKASSVEDRIYSMTGVHTRPICYCAGYKEGDMPQLEAYNLTKLLYYIVQSIPMDKRLVIVNNINPDKDKWLHDDAEEEYREKVRQSFWEALVDSIFDNAEEGSTLGGKIFGYPGRILGTFIGGAWGAIKGLFKRR